MVDGAADALRGAKDLPDHAREVDGVGAGAHDSAERCGVRAGMGTRGPLPRGRGRHTCHAPHGGPRAVPGGVEDVLDGDVAVVFDVLNLLPVPGRLLQRLDDEGGGGGNHGAGGLPVLHLQLHGHLQTLPVAGGLGNVVSDLLGGQTEGTNLKWKRNLIMKQHAQMHYQFVEFCTETVTYLEDGIQLGRSWTPKA